MYNDEYAASAAGAAAKVGLLKKNPLGYFLLSALAGAYIGFGILLSFTVSGTLGAIPMNKIAMGLSFGIALSLVIIAGAELFTGNAFVLYNGWRSKTVTLTDVVRLWVVCYLGNWFGAIPMNKIAMGLSFGIALSLVIIAGAELFTGNAFVLYNGWRSKTVTLTDVVRLWVVCYLGNWFGAIVLSLIFYGAAGTAGGTGQALANAAAMKMSLPPLVLFLKGILCNVLVCLAVWCGFRCKSDSGKLIMVFWCLYAFFTCGFEHSVANMTVLTLGLLNPAGTAVSLGGYFYNLFMVTLGNIVGAVLFLSIPYGIAAKKIGD